MQHVPLAEHRLRVAGLVCGLLLWLTCAVLMTGPNGAPVHRAQDFPQFYALGRLVVEHRPADLQDGEALARIVREEVSPDIHWTLLPVYGPQVALAMAPLSTGSYRTAEVAWLAISVLLYGLAVRRLLREAPGLTPHVATAWLLAAASPGLFQLIWYGQLSMVALLLVVTGCSLWGRGRLFAAGLAFGLLVYKPQYGIAIAVVAVAMRAWPLVGGALLAAIGELAVAWLYAGTAVMERYVATLLSTPSQLGVLQSNQHLMQSVLAIAQLVPGRAGPVVVYVSVSLIVLAITVRIWRQTTSSALRHSALVLSGLLVSPHVYIYDLVLLTPVLVWMTGWMLDQPSPRQPAGLTAVQARALRWSLGMLYAWPVAGLILTYYGGINAGPVVMLALLAVVHQAATYPAVPRTCEPANP